MVLNTPAGLLLAAYALVITWVAWYFFRMLWGHHSQEESMVKHYGEDRRRVPYAAPCPIPSHISLTEKFVMNARGMLLYTCAWHPSHIERPKALIFQCCGFADTNTFLPMMRSIRLAERGFVVVGMDPEGHGRSDGLHAYVPSFPTLVEDYWQFFIKEIMTNPAYAGLPVFLLGESMGGNVAIQLLLRDRTEKKKNPKKHKSFFAGAVFLAPMVKISPALKPPECLVNLLRQVAPFIPTLPVAPTKDVLAQAFRRPDILEMARNSPYGYRMKPRLGTALQLLEATEEVAGRMEEVEHPFLLLQGDADVVTCPEVIKEFHAKAGSKDKELKLYEGMWHSLVGGELEPHIERVYGDMFAWLERQLLKQGKEEEEDKEEEEKAEVREVEGMARRRSTRRSVKVSGQRKGREGERGREGGRENEAVGL